MQTHLWSFIAYIFQVTTAIPTQIESLVTQMISNDSSFYIWQCSNKYRVFGAVYLITTHEAVSVWSESLITTQLWDFFTFVLTLPIFSLIIVTAVNSYTHFCWKTTYREKH